MEHSRITEHERDEITKIVSDTMKRELPAAMDEYFKGKGLTGKTFLINLALVIGAITVIGGGLKFILGWVGFSYLKP